MALTPTLIISFLKNGIRGYNVTNNLKRLTYRLIMKRTKVKLSDYDRIVFYIDEKNKALIQK